jgi:transposase
MDETDPDLILANSPPEYFKQVAGKKRNYDQLTLEEAAEDMKNLVRIIKQMGTENERLRKAEQALSRKLKTAEKDFHEKLKRERRWRNGLVAAMTFMWVAFVWLVKVAAPVIIKGLGL